MRLSEDGMTQARSLLGYYDVVIISPLVRALQTYSCSQIKSGQVLVSPLFREHRNNQECNYFYNEERVQETDEEFKQRTIKAMGYIRGLVSPSVNSICVIAHHDFIAKFSTQVHHQPVYLPNLGFISFHLNV